MGWIAGIVLVASFVMMFLHYGDPFRNKGIGLHRMKRLSG